MGGGAGGNEFPDRSRESGTVPEAQRRRGVCGFARTVPGLYHHYRAGDGVHRRHRHRTKGRADRRRLRSERDRGQAGGQLRQADHGRRILPCRSSPRQPAGAGRQDRLAGHGHDGLPQRPAAGADRQGHHRRGPGRRERLPGRGAGAGRIPPEAGQAPAVPGY